MMTTPIPKYLLPHTAVLVTQGGADKWGNTSAEVRTELSHIRINPARYSRYAVNGDSTNISAVLFYDCVNSLPAGVEFKLEGDDTDTKRQKVIFNGREYVVVKINSYYGVGGMHHYEVDLA